MKSQSSVLPEKIVVSSLKDGKRRVYLRRDIRKSESAESVDNETPEDNLFEYEEVCIEMQDRDDLSSYIENNFDKLFEEALKQEHKKTIAMIKYYLSIKSLGEKDIDYYVASGILKDKREVL